MTKKEHIYTPRNVNRLEYVDQLEDDKVWIGNRLFGEGSFGSGKVLDRDTKQTMHVSSDFWQIAYLRYRGILPVCSKVRVFRHRSSGQIRKKVFYVFEDTPVLAEAIKDLYDDKDGALSIFQAYDAVRKDINTQMWGKK